MPPYNGSGVFAPPAADYPAVANTLIQSTKRNNIDADFATGLTTAVTKDGQTTPTANLPMGGFKLTGMGAGSAANDSVRLAQVQAGAMFRLTSAAGTNTITATAVPTLAAYASGNQFTFVPQNTNTGATTINIDGLGAKNVYANNVACTGGELVASVPAIIHYDGTQFQIVGTGALATRSGRETLDNKNLGLLFNGPTSVTTSPLAISTVAASAHGSIAIVQGDSTTNVFADLVFFSTAVAAALASQTVSGSPANRTYTAVAGVLTLQMASGTYAVRVKQIY